MTFHVRYNDCHLEEDMWREGEEDKALVQRRGEKMVGGVVERRKGGQSGDGNDLGHL